MATNQLTRMVYRQDQILALPFPPAPSLARQIDNGVLKKEGAIRHDEEVKRDREKIQNILKLWLRWPKLEEWQAQVTNVTNVVSNVTTIQTTVTQISADLTALTAAIVAQSLIITSLQSSVANLTAAINTLSIAVADIQANFAPTMHFARDPRILPVIQPVPAGGSTLAPIWGVDDTTNERYLWNGIEWI